MEFTIVHTDIKASEIKPKESLLKYMALTEKDVQNLFSNVHWSTRSCPACKSSKVRSEFKKLGFDYVRCKNCYSIYAVKTPSSADLERYYQKGASRDFWFKEIGSKTATIRAEKVVRPLIDWTQRVLVSNKVKRKQAKIAIVGPTDSGFIDGWKSEGNPLNVIAPLFPNAKSEDKLKENHYDAILLIHTLDRLTHPAEELKKVYYALRTGGALLVTSILSSGLDNLILGRDSETIIPPDRINSFSYEGLIQLIEQSGFIVEEFSTPGELDVENIIRELDKVSNGSKEFFEYISTKREGTSLIEKLQDFLQENCLSSRARIVAIKK